MGKVLSAFGNGYAGAISRQLDDVVISLANTGNDAIAFGAPVVLDEDKVGAVKFGSTNTAAQFVGIATRIGVKTPAAYGENLAQYDKGDIMSVIVRGHVVVPLAGESINVGDPVSIKKADGTFAVATGDTYVALSNARVSTLPDANGMAEIVLTSRNLI